MRWRHRFGGGTRSETVHHDVALDGLSEVALSRLRPGATAEVRGIHAGCKARYRLASLGLIPGSLLRVVANPGIGPLLLSVGESRLMVERGVAAKVSVRRF